MLHSDSHSVIISGHHYALGTNIGVQATWVKKEHDSVLIDCILTEVYGQSASNPTND